MVNWRLEILLLDIYLVSLLKYVSAFLRTNHNISLLALLSKKEESLKSHKFFHRARLASSSYTWAFKETRLSPHIIFYFGPFMFYMLTSDVLNHRPPLLYILMPHTLFRNVLPFIVIQILLLVTLLHGVLDKHPAQFGPPRELVPHCSIRSCSQWVHSGHFHLQNILRNFVLKDINMRFRT